MDKYKVWILNKWQPLLIGLALVVVMGSVLTFRLGTLNKGATLPEVTYLHSVDSGKNLFADPTFLIHKLPSYLLFKLGFSTITVYRLVSTLFVGITVICSFIILKTAYSTRVAILGAILFLTSAWTLHIGRSATPEATFLLILPLVLVASWMHNTVRHYYSLLILSLVLVISVYIPGFWWLAIILIAWERRAILSALKSVPWWFRLVSGSLITVGLIPLIWATAHNPSTLLAISGLPRHLPSLHLLAKNLLDIPQNLFVSGPIDPTRWLGHIPILDLFSIVMLVLGVYSLRYHFKQHTIQILVGSTFLVIWLVALGGLTTITALIPLLYVFISVGVAFMLQQWMTVFPRNPIAHTLATTLMSISILLVAYYHINHYFIAWPQTPATKRIFGHSLIK